jgi:2-(1,2-epoxy-1,2-dihydrophenyl)acetyl-CoA isomerase
LKSPIVRVDKKGSSWVIINRPEVRNALDLETANQLSKALEECASDDGCRVVVLTGEGDCFCAGGDVAAMHKAEKGNELGHYLRRISRAINRSILTMKEMKKPVVAAVNGSAMGAGFSLLLGADLRIAVDTAKFAMSFRNIGLAPGCGTYLLPRMIGQAKASQLVLMGDVIDANEAWRLGLVNITVKPKDLVKVTEEYIHNLTSGPTRALALSKDLLNKSLEGAMSDHCEREAEAIGRSGENRDGKEGIRAFVEKRRPKFL